MTKSALIPSRTSRSRSSTTSRSRKARSSDPSGSSSIRSPGAGARARASATRCCSPPERSRTERRSNPARPTSASASWARGGGLGPAHVVGPQAEGDVPDDVAVGEQRVVLEHEPEVAAVRRDAGEIDAVAHDPARGERLQPGDGPQQRALAAPARPEHAHDLAVADGQVDAVDGARTVRGAVRRQRHRRAGRARRRPRARASERPDVADPEALDAEHRHDRSAPSGSCSRPWRRRSSGRRAGRAGGRS